MSAERNTYFVSGLNAGAAFFTLGINKGEIVLKTGKYTRYYAAVVIYCT